MCRLKCHFGTSKQYLPPQLGTFFVPTEASQGRFEEQPPMRGVIQLCVMLWGHLQSSVERRAYFSKLPHLGVVFTRCIEGCGVRGLQIGPWRTGIALVAVSEARVRAPIWRKAASITNPEVNVAKSSFHVPKCDIPHLVKWGM